ncbi:MAG: AGE family epimerase/isomerase [Ginsengibacter sp.]
MKELINTYRKEMNDQLKSILSFWMKETIDNTNGGFYGKIDNYQRVYPDAPKGAVLNSRILWAFSSAYQLTNEAAYLQTADRSFNYIRDYFFDKEFGGVYWSVDFKGNPLDLKKQFYALSFAIYGLSEFYKCTNNSEAKKMAIDLYYDIINHSYDSINGGYIEALSGDWKQLDDLRLSKKDANERKSMNTHLHILEGFANLYLIWPDEDLKQKIEELILIFLEHIIDKNNYHLILFFDDEWNKRSDIISYGHDIEAAWLIQEAAGIIKEKVLIEKVKTVSVQLADAAAEGLDSDGGLWYEYDVDNDHLIKEKHWWPQAEAMVGFFNAWQITGKEDYFGKSMKSWHFVKEYILDKQNGEWLWGIKDDYKVIDEDKIGVWKCPYHNTRACLEIIKRIDKTESLYSKAAHEIIG